MTEPRKLPLRAENGRLILDGSASAPEAFELGVAHGMGMAREAMSKKTNSALAQRNASLALAVGALVVSNWQSIKTMSSSLMKKYDECYETKRKETE